MISKTKLNVCITGASSGIGRACAEIFSTHGHSVFLGARREEKFSELQKKYATVHAKKLDVTSTQSCQDFSQNVLEVFDGSLDVLINNAGLAIGRDSFEKTLEKDWQTIFETNVLGVWRLTQLFLPEMMAKKNGHIINVGSIAGFWNYEGGGAYSASKHALRSMTQTLRLELCGKGIRVSEIAPGMVETEFSEVRFHGDKEGAKKVYAGMTPLTGEDIADSIYFIATRPKHINIDHLVMMPLDQASATKVHRA